MRHTVWTRGVGEEMGEAARPGTQRLRPRALRARGRSLCVPCPLFRSSTHNAEGAARCYFATGAVTGAADGIGDGTASDFTEEAGDGIGDGAVADCTAALGVFGAGALGGSTGIGFRDGGAPG